jgi:hypothetical protein
MMGIVALLILILSLTGTLLWSNWRSFIAEFKHQFWSAQLSSLQPS